MPRWVNTPVPEMHPGRRKRAPQIHPGRRKRAPGGGRYECLCSFLVLVGRGGFVVHGHALGGSGFIDDAFKQAADGGIGQRAFIILLGVGKDFLLAHRLVDGHVALLLDAANFECALRALVQEFDQFFVDFVHAAAPVGEGHWATSRRESPLRPACFSRRMRSASAFAAASGEDAFSISETKAEPITAASASPPSRVTWPGKETPKPTAMGSCVKWRARRSMAGRSSGRESLAPV